MDRIIYGANWYIDSLNMRLSLARVKLPDMKHVYETLVLGGGWFGLEVPSEIEPLRAEFSLNGGHEYVRRLFGKEPGDYTTFHYYERLRDIMEGQNRGRYVRIRGLVGEVTQPEVRGKKANEVTAYGIRTIMLYEDVMDGQVIHRMDVKNNRLIIDGIDYTAEHNSIIAA